MNEPEPAEFLEQIRATLREQRRQAGGVEDEPADAERLVMNRAAIVLFLQSLKEMDPLGHYQLPAVVMLGQRGQVGFLEGCPVYYDPTQDVGGEDDAFTPVVRYLIET